MAASAPPWKTSFVCPVDPLALSPPQANRSQPQGRREEEPEKRQCLIGNGLTEWMAEEVDFALYFPVPHSSPSPNSSLPPSPLKQDIQVPSDLEVMTSLLQEELAQLEDYFLSDSLSEKPLNFGKYDKVSPAAGPQSYYQLPYASYTNSGQSESSPLLVTLATGELDLLSFCGGPIGRSKTPRHAPYVCSRPNSNGRKRFCDGLRLGEAVESSIWNSKGSNSVSPEVAVTGNYCSVENEKAVGKGCRFGSMVEIRKCGILAKEAKSYCYPEVDDKFGGGYTFGDESPDIPHKIEERLPYGVQDVQKVISSDNGMAIEAFCDDRCSNIAQAVGWKMEMEEGNFLHVGVGGAHHSFLGGVDKPLKTGVLETGCQHSSFSNFLEDQSSECLSAGEEEWLDLGSAGHVAALGQKEHPSGGTHAQELGLVAQQGPQKQKKRDQNKTAAHRYRQRKRAELDSLEEQLHGLECRNRELRDKAESVEREIQYVKDLLIEVYKARSQRLKEDGCP
ncbi:hypothetical protein COCON_G00084070 [Conger conger]|uniref:BZIP domain-containing protein n=1 Tax=Conger conger TaxID=82655 RepID=A0A9Q1DQB2_CONCO|nr:uncharacterized protein LOC133133794 [Conger conger]KAJ8276655.1 hypothetical protein COCON_G00084070 [Conger conger]